MAKLSGVSFFLGGEGAALREMQVPSFVTAPRLSVPVSFHSPANGGMLPDAGW